MTKRKYKNKCRKLFDKVDRIMVFTIFVFDKPGEMGLRILLFLVSLVFAQFKKSASILLLGENTFAKHNFRVLKSVYRRTESFR